MKTMNALKPALLAAACVFALAACQETPRDTAEDVAEARVDGQENIAEAQADLRETQAEVRTDLNEAAVDQNEMIAGDRADYREAVVDAGESTAAAQRDVAMAKVDAAYNIAEEKCEGLEMGSADRDRCMTEAKSAQETAKLEANNAYDMAQASADARRE